MTDEISGDVSLSAAAHRMRQGDPIATREVYEKLFPRVLGLIPQLIAANRIANVDAEEVAQSAFMSFWQSAKSDRLYGPLNCESLWSILAKITLHKGINHHRAIVAKKRGSGRIREESSITNGTDAEFSLDKLSGRVLSHEYELAFKDLQQTLNPDLQEVVVLRLPGFSNQEIWEATGCSLRQTERKFAQRQMEQYSGKLREASVLLAADGDLTQRRHTFSSLWTSMRRLGCSIDAESGKRSGSANVENQCATGPSLVHLECIPVNDKTHESIIRSRRPACGKQHKIQGKYLEKQAKCNQCHAKFTVTSVDQSGSSNQAETKSLETQVSETSVFEPSPSEKIPNRRSGASTESEPTLKTINRFQVKAIVGAGAYGIFYRAYDPVLKRQVALKEPKFDIHDQRRRRRFMTEAKSAAQLRHPNIVVVFDGGETEEVNHTSPLSLSTDALSRHSLTIRRTIPSAQKPKLAESWSLPMHSLTPIAKGSFMTCPHE